MSKPIKLIKYDTVDSTNAEAKRLAAAGKVRGFTFIMAERQTAGRGRGGRKWLNTDGALLMTMLAEHKGSARELPLLGFAAAMAVKNALVRMTDGALDLSVKWPNDVISLPGGEKLCGILSESFSIDNKVFAAVGVGVNINCEALPEGLLQPATSVYMQTGVKLDPEEAAFAIAREFVELTALLEKDCHDFLDLYWQECSTIGSRVSVAFGAPDAEGNGGSGLAAKWGSALDVAEDGGLVVRFEDGTERTVYAADVSVRNLRVIDEGLAFSLLPERDPKGNKGSNGRAGMIVGSPGMAGAAVMSTAAAVRAGAGLTRALIPKQIEYAFAALPEAMLVTDDSRAEELISWASALCVGCGMGVNERTKTLVERALLSNKPCVIDADGLNSIASELRLAGLLHPNCVLTPHPGEMARLCGRTVEEVLADFTGTALRCAKEHGCTVLLKSAESVIVSPEGIVRYNTSGNSGLAKGGSGDVLAGIVTGLMAQGASPFDAASLGSYLLGCSAQKALEILAERFITAPDAASAIEMTLAGIFKRVNN